ncbi:vigilin [Lutzomyia longipalpis]|nr:vigilin [Lutzomyia longipalpis]
MEEISGTLPIAEHSAAGFNYDDLFPALPESSTPAPPIHNATTMRVGSSVVTQVFRVPYSERKFDSEKFGEGESLRTCQNIMKDTGAHIEISSGKDLSLTFLISGKHSEVLDARRKILVHFQTQASKQIPIPKEHHRWILGKKGERLKELEKVTSTKISVPNISEDSDLITIAGTKEGIEKAEHEIKTISDEQSRKAMEKIVVPKVYHPFILGPFNENLNKMIEETGARINVPPQSVMKDEIIITGEKEGVFEAKSRIEAIYKEMESKCTTVSMEVPREQHKYVSGNRGSTIQEILQLTGVSVEIPPNDSTTNTIILRGPQEHLGDALSTVCAKANSVKSVQINAPAWIHKYIIGRKGANIKELSAEFVNVHVEFGDNRIKIEGPPDQVNKASEQLSAIVDDYVNKLTYRDMTVNPKHYKHIIGKAGTNINRLKDELDVVINIEEKDGLNRIRIEGPIDGVLKAEKELTEKIEKLENEKEKDVIIDHRLFRTIIGAKGENIKEIRERFKQVQIMFPNLNDKTDIVKLRGPKDDVDRCSKHLLKIVKDLQESSFIMELPIFKQFHKFIIGKGGANIKKIRDETHTKIDLPAEGDENEVIMITGKKENVLEARDRIKKIQDELSDIVTEEIVIPPEYYNFIIGAGGKLISSIMEECGNVSIKFPSPESKSDKVTIRGPKEDVQKAKQQLIEMSNERQQSSFTAEVRAKQQHHKFLIGKNGASIRKIRDNTGARIVFPTSTDEDKEVITIIGRKDSVEAARQQLELIIKDIDNIVEDEITVDPKHHRYFVAKRGEVLHRIAEECGGLLISFPRPGVDSDRVTLKGARNCIDAAKQRIQELIHNLENQVTIECVIPQRHHRTVMGSRGRKVQEITARYDVQIKFPDRELNSAESMTELNGGDGGATGGAPAEEAGVRTCDVIKITGNSEKCEAAKQALFDLIPITQEINVPFDLHRSIIGQKGQNVRELMHQYDVHIELSPPDQKSDVIKITGAAANVEDAKEAVLKRVEELEQDRKDRELRSFELKIEIDSDYHPKIIGRKGNVINQIRADHGVQISFPKKDDAADNIITIQGYEHAAYAARDAIMKIANALNNLAKETVEVDVRIYPRLIGQRGRNIRRIMDEFKVEVKFPKTGDANPNVVTIVGNEDAVAECKDYILNLEEEYLQDVADAQPAYQPMSVSDVFEEALTKSGLNHRSGGESAGQPPKGFVVKGAPWQKKAPNTSSHEDFPDFGLGANTPATNDTPTLSSAWGLPR